MFILLNMSKKIDGFNLYRNTFFPLLRDYTLDIIDVSKKIDDVNLDYNSIKLLVEDALVKANSSKYSLVILYDFNMQSKEPLVYSLTAVLNNLQRQVIDEIRHSYIMDNMYLVALDDVERDFDGQIINENLKNGTLFDKFGYFNDENYKYVFSDSDFELIESGLKTLVKSYKKNDKIDEYDKLFNEYDKKYLKNVEERIVKALDNDIDKNDLWYEVKVKEVFADYRKEIKGFLKDVAVGKDSIENLVFSLKSYVESKVSSYSNTQQNKIFRLNLLDDKGKYCRDEAMYKNYYKIISFINYLVTGDKKYIFGGAFNINENHYIVNVSISDDNIKTMLSNYYTNILNEEERLGDVRFNEVVIEEYEHYTIDTNIENTKKYTTQIPKFSLFRNDDNLDDAKNYAMYLRERYIDFVNYCNQRLRKITDRLRVTRNKEIVGRKKNVSLNELQRIVEEKQERAKELEEKIASNTPSDIIQIDFRIFDENEKKVKEVNKILNKRITIIHFLFNIVVIAAFTLIFIPMFRRFDLGIVGAILKIILYLLPVITYAVVQLIFCKRKVAKAKSILADMENYTKGKLQEIHVDDERFKVYVNNIYELMMLTKYIDKLNDVANNSSVDIENFRYHKNELNKAVTNVSNLSKLLKIRLVKTNVSHSNNMMLDIAKNIVENDIYCPLLYANETTDNYILINNQHKEKIDSELLNVVNSIKLDFDEEYDEIK